MSVTHTLAFPRADSVITFHFNPIGWIRLEWSNVSLASDHVSCCVCALQPASNMNTLLEDSAWNESLGSIRLFGSLTLIHWLRRRANILTRDFFASCEKIVHCSILNWLVSLGQLGQVTQGLIIMEICNRVPFLCSRECKPASWLIKQTVSPLSVTHALPPELMRETRRNVAGHTQ